MILWQGYSCICIYYCLCYISARECISNISEKIEGMLNTTAGQQEIQGQYLTLDTDNFGIPVQQLQVNFGYFSVSSYDCLSFINQIYSIKK